MSEDVDAPVNGSRDTRVRVSVDLERVIKDAFEAGYYACFNQFLSKTGALGDEPEDLDTLRDEAHEYIVRLRAEHRTKGL